MHIKEVEVKLDFIGKGYMLYCIGILVNLEVSCEKFMHCMHNRNCDMICFLAHR